MTIENISASVVDPLSIAPTFSTTFTLPSQRPNRDEVIQRVQAFYLARWPWISSEAKVDYSKSDMDEWGPLTCPFALDDRAELCSSYVTFFFLYDDALEEMNANQTKKSVERVTGIISRRPEAIPTDMDPIEAIIHELCCRIESVGSDASRTLAATLFSDTCRYIRTAGNKKGRAESLIGGFDKYVAYRIEEGGFWFTFSLALWGQDILVPCHIWGDMFMKPIQRLTGAHEMLVNDMFSYRWEHKLHRAAFDPKKLHHPAPDDHYVLYNVITALLHEGKNNGEIKPDNVMEHLRSYISKIEEDFPILVEAFKKKYRSEPPSVARDEDLEMVDRVVEAMMNFMAGNALWSTRCGRYNGVWQVFDCDT